MSGPVGGQPAVPRWHGQSGATSVELLIAAALGLVVALGIGVTNISVLRNFREGAERLRLQQSVDRISQQVEIAVRQAATCRIYDPDHASVELAAGPAVELLDAAGARVGRILSSPDGRYLVDNAGRRFDDLPLDDAWFERTAEGNLRLTLGFRDATGNLTVFPSEITPRN